MERESRSIGKIYGCLRYGGPPNFYSTVYGLTDFNPHCALTAISEGKDQTLPATAPDWQHWRPDRPTAPHWYTAERFRALVTLLLGKERDGGKARSVNEFIREFHGLSATAKAKAIAQGVGLTGAMLHDLVDGDDVDMKRLTALLLAMQTAARPVKPEALGLLGQGHLTANVEGYGAAADSVEYRRALGEVEGLPYVLEVAFGVKRDGSQMRTLSVGINFSPALTQPFPALDTALTEARCTCHDPVVVLVHLACPLVSFADRGKSRALVSPVIAADLQRLVKLATARFTQAKRQADRNDRMDARALEELRNAHKVKPMTVKAAAWKVMEQAYRKASSNGTLPANARQIMYAARPLIIELTGKASPWKKSSTFTQNLLPDFIEAHPDLCASWDVVFDDRGHFAEPHTGRKIGVGTLAVRGYIQEWTDSVGDGVTAPELEASVDTTGPALRYRFALFVEKEGFNLLLERAQIQERYDLALLSTKGMSVTAARALVERLSKHGVTIFVLHDFDKSGFTICHTLQTDTRRYRFKTAPHVIDLGLRLGDVEDMGLDSEAVSYSSDVDPRPGLIQHGATPEEAAYLVTGQQEGRWVGQRVELNALDSQQFIDWVEGKLQAHGVTKFLPDADTLKVAWKRNWRIAQLNEAIASAVKNLPDPPDPPADLEQKMKERLAAHPAIGWDKALEVNP